VYYEPAHDSLIRSWNLIGDWIKQYGKNLLYLQQDLSEAVKKFKDNPKKLWHEDSRLDTLLNILKSSDNWLNQPETNFVKKSEQRRWELEERKNRRQQELIEERDKVIAYEKKQKELLTERLYKQEYIAELNEQKERALKEKLEEAKAKTRLQKERTWLTLVGLLLLSIAATYAFSQYKKANYNLKQSFSYIDSIKVLRQQDSLSKVKLTGLYDDVNVQAALANKQATEATEARIKADSAAQKEKKARLEVERQRKELLLQQTALIQSRDSVNRYSQSLRKYLDSLNYQLAIIQSKDKEIEYTKLTASFLTKSRSLMRSDPALAYQLALESLKYDSTNKRIKDYIYDTLNHRNSFYESFILENATSAFFSDDGKNVLVVQGDKNLTFLDLTAHKEIPVQVPAKILSAQFSSIDNSALVTTKTNIYKYSPDGQQKESPERYDNLLKAAYTAKGKIIVVMPNEIRIKRSIDAAPSMTILTKDNTDDTEVSSNDTLLYVRKNGIIETYDLTNGRIIRTYREPNSFLGKDGNGFIAVNGNEILIARSSGNRVIWGRYYPPLENGYTKISIVSIADNMNSILFLAEPEERQQQLQQQQQQQQKISKNFIRSARMVSPPALYTFTAPRTISKMALGIPSSRQIVLSDNGAHIMTGESGSLTVYDREGKRLERFGGYTNYLSWTFNPVNTDMVLSMSLGPGGSRLKLWIKGTPNTLSAQNKLRKFNASELEKALEDVAFR
jgi:hypothetical protein